MSFRHLYRVRASIALTCLSFSHVAAAQVTAQAVPLSAEHARALGCAPARVSATETLDVGTHARVVFKPDAQYVVAAPYPASCRVCW